MSRKITAITILFLFVVAAGSFAQSAADLYAAGRSLYQYGKIPEAREKFEASARAAGTEGNRKALCDAYLGIAMMDQTVYAYESALGYYLKMKDIAELLDYQGPLSSYYNNVGVIYKYQGRIDDAITLYRKSLELRIKLAGADSPLAAVVHNNLGVLYDEQGDSVNAKQHLEKALKIREEELGPTDLDTAITYMNYASFLEKDDSTLTQALDYYNKALKAYINQLPPDHPSIARVYEGIAGILARPSFGSSSALAGRTQEAEEYYEKTLAIYKARGMENGYLAGAIFSKLGDIREGKKKYEDAVKNYKKAVAIFDESRNRIGLDSRSRATYLARVVQVYKKLALNLFKLKDFSSAFYYTELSKSRSLLDDISKNAVFFGTDIDSATRKTFDGLREKAQVYEQAITDKRKSGRPSTQEEVELAKVNDDYSARLKDLYAKFPRYRSILESKILSSKETQGLLDESTVLVEYSVMNGEILAFILTRNGLEAKLLPVWDLAASVKALREWILFGPGAPEGERGLIVEGPIQTAAKTKGEQAAKPASDPRRVLYKTLIEPLALSLKNAKRVIIIPDGELAFIPFELLQDDGGRYFIENRDVAYVQSASLAGRLTRKAAAGRLPFVAFGGAWYGKDGDKAPGPFVPGTSQGTVAKLDSTDRGLSVISAGEPLGAVYTTLGYSWKNLPGTTDEVKAAGVLFYPQSADERNKHIFLGSEVREDRVKELGTRETLQKYAIVHFATHGIVNPEFPALSALVLSQPEVLAVGGVKKTGEDGYLTMGEIVALRLDADLVTLSACETGLGKLLDGEGVIGLTQSFLLAGAKNVSVSLWSVSDAATKEFMIRFYTKVKEGKTFVAALSEVKREFLKGKYDKAFYWAPFVLYGAF